MNDDEVYRPEDIKEGYHEPPVPYEEQMAEGEHWVPDYYDQAIPTAKGFITDFVYYTRGFETPTLSCIWTALFILSSALKREVWFKWAPDGLFTNQYIIIIGPAGIVKKTTAVSVIGLPILRKFRNWIADKNVFAMKTVTVVKDKVTPEALLNSILPENKDGHDVYLVDDMGNNILGVDGRAVRYKRTSECALVVSELSTMLGKASYAEAMIPNLLDLYDCHKDWDWVTLSRGKKTLRNLHTTLLAGTTVEGLRSSIPPSAMGDGFLSRTIPVYVPDTKRCYRQPFIPKNAPTEDELAKRLAWIASNCMGEFKLTKEADEFMDGWYRNFKDYLRANPAVSGAMSRMDVNVYKTALLMRAQRYDDTSPYITKEDLLNAIRLLDLTYSSFPFLRSQISPDDLTMWTAKIGEYVRKRKRVGRLVTLQRTHIKSEMATLVFEELLAKGYIKAFYDGKEISHATTRSTEEYEWVGEGADGTGTAGVAGEGASFNYSKTVWHDTPDSAGAGGQPHGFATVPEAGRTGRPVRPRTRAQAEAGADESAPRPRKGRPPKVAGGAPERDAPERKHQGDCQEDGVLDRSGEDVHVQSAEGTEGATSTASRSKEGWTGFTDERWPASRDKEA